MGKKKQQKKQQKKQRKQSPKKAGAVKGKAQKRIYALKEENRSLERRVADLQRQLEEIPVSRPGLEPSDEQPIRKVASDHRVAWERYTYLHDRYEAYIERGAEKEAARSMANRDLIEKFGKKAGYTKQQLDSIFL